MGLENVMEETLMGTEEHLAKTKGGGGCPYASSSPSIRQVREWLLIKNLQGNHFYLKVSSQTMSFRHTY